MNSKSFLMLFAFLGILFINAQKKDDVTIVGKWQHVSTSGSNGAKMFTNKVKNGNILEFFPSNKITDNKGHSGYYKLNGEKLEISLDKKVNYFRVFFNGKKEMNLSPVTADYQIICDEGCSDKYQKIK